MIQMRNVTRAVVLMAFSTTLSFFKTETRPAAGQSSRPYIVLVNGYQNCCARGILDRLPQINADIRSVPYSNFSDGGSSGNTSDDSAFLRDGANFINNQLDKNRPLILIGHSFGGDSVLKLLPRINRRIQFVAVIDPVSTGGFRATLSRYRVPENVDYFFNRWQTNVVFPNDFPVSGLIASSARKSDQEEESIARNEDSSPSTERHK
jgi:pimeloyl-ACP methyl ester carboxylesterase